jgi:hypothetical protein
LSKIDYGITLHGPLAELARKKARAKTRAKAQLHAQATAARRIVDWESSSEFAKRSSRLYCRVHRSVFGITAILANLVQLSCGCTREGFNKLDPLSITVTKARRKTAPVFFEEPEPETESEAETEKT